MSLVFSLLLKMDAQQAKAGLRELQGELGKSGTQAQVMATGAKAAGGAVDGLGDKAAGASGQIDALARAQTKASQTASVLQRSNGAAAASMGNLVANFNDIGVMLAAGQNPLQLAIQQGTQITQVIGPMGAAGAARALGGAFLTMLSPINLVTLGVIGFGAAAIQWLSGSSEEAVTLEKRFSELLSAIDALDKANKRASMSATEMRQEFGSAAPEMRQALIDLANIAKVDAFEKLRASAGAMREEVLGRSFWSSDDRSTESVAQDFLGLSNFYQQNRDAAAVFVSNLNVLRSTADESTRLRAALDLKAQMESTLGGYDRMNGAQRQLYNGLTELVFQMGVLGVKADAAASGLDKDLIARLGRAVGRGEKAQAADTAAREELAILQQQAAIRAADAQYGRDSARAALARLEAERHVHAALVEASDASDALKQQLLAAWDAANGLARARIAAAIEDALSPASRLSAYLKAAAGWFGQIQSDAAIAAYNRDSQDGSMVYGGRGGDPRDFLPGGKKDYSGRFVYRGPALDEFNQPKEAGGGGGAKAEGDAVAELIKRLREEQEVLRETDPVKKEMLKYREQLAGASAKERGEVEQLIRAEQQLEAVRSATDFLSSTAADALDALIVRGESAIDVIKNLARSLLSAAAQAFMLGTGPLAGLLGTSGSILSLLIPGKAAGGEVAAMASGGEVAAAMENERRAVLSSPARVSAMAAGGQRIAADARRTPARNLAGFRDARARDWNGLITGPGGPREDRIPTWLSAGEYVVNAAATAEYRSVLERINSGQGLASGGPVGAGWRPSGGSSSGRMTEGGAGPVVLQVNVSGARGNAEIEEMAFKGAAKAIQAYDRQVLPARLKGFSGKSREVG